MWVPHLLLKVVDTAFRMLYLRSVFIAASVILGYMYSYTCIRLQWPSEQQNEAMEDQGKCKSGTLYM